MFPVTLAAWALVDDQKKEWFDLGKLPWKDQTFGRTFDPHGSNRRADWSDIFCQADFFDTPSIDELRRRFSVWCDLGDWAPKLHAFLVTHKNLRWAHDSNDSIPTQEDGYRCVGTRYNIDPEGL
jgi:hypothetical protein